MNACFYKWMNERTNKLNGYASIKRNIQTTNQWSKVMYSCLSFLFQLQLKLSHVQLCTFIISSRILFQSISVVHLSVRYLQLSAARDMGSEGQLKWFGLLFDVLSMVIILVKKTNPYHFFKSRIVYLICLNRSYFNVASPCH